MLRGTSASMASHQTTAARAGCSDDASAVRTVLLHQIVCSCSLSPPGGRGKGKPELCVVLVPPSAHGDRASAGEEESEAAVTPGSAVCSGGEGAIRALGSGRPAAAALAAAACLALAAAAVGVPGNKVGCDVALIGRHM